MSNDTTGPELPPATEYAESHAVELPDGTADLPEELAPLLPGKQWWQARPTGSRLVGLVVARDDMPSVARQRESLAEFGVPIEGFRHPAPEIGETWEERLNRLFGRLGSGDVLVVANTRSLGRDSHEETRTIAALRHRGVIVKVLDHAGAPVTGSTPVLGDH